MYSSLPQERVLHLRKCKSTVSVAITEFKLLMIRSFTFPHSDLFESLGWSPSSSHVVERMNEPTSVGILSMDNPDLIKYFIYFGFGYSQCSS